MVARQQGKAAMAIVRIRFDGGEVPIVTGSFPPDESTPIDLPSETDFITNKAFIVDQGIYCFGLQTDIPHKPLWQRVQAVDGVPAQVSFARAT
jgi:hypothetical protein